MPLINNICMMAIFQSLDLVNKSVCQSDDRKEMHLAILKFGLNVTVFSLHHPAPFITYM